MKKRKVLLCIIAFLCVFGMVFDVNAEGAIAGNLTTSADQLPDTVARTVGPSFTKDSNDTGSKVVLSTGDGYVLYCSDRNNETIDNDTLTKAEKMDYGIAYILLNSYPKKKLISGVVENSADMLKADYCSTDLTDEMMNVWITQQAIWGFQGVSTKATAVSKALKYSKTEDLTKSCSAYTYNNNALTGYILWDSYVQNLINNAKQASANAPENAKVSIKTTEKWTKEKDAYKSDLIEITGAGSYQSYSLSFANAPTGLKVYKEDGTEITNKLTDIPSNAKFYITIPVDQANKGPKFTMTTSMSITYDAAYQYVDKTTNHQPSVLVGKESKQISGIAEITLLPNTASKISNSIYFVGFLILLCGAGIIYVNVKPRKQTNE